MCSFDTRLFKIKDPITGLPVFAQLQVLLLKPFKNIFLVWYNIDKNAKYRCHWHAIHVGIKA